MKSPVRCKEFVNLECPHRMMFDRNMELRSFLERFLMDECKVLLNVKDILCTLPFGTSHYAE